MHESQSLSGITSVLRRIQRLDRRLTRDREGCCWIEGVRSFIHACDAGLHFEVILHAPILLKNPTAEKLARKAKAAGVPCLRVTPEQFREVSLDLHASGIGAIVRLPWKQLADLQPTAGLGWLVIEELRSAGNLGTILRTAEATGVQGVLFVGPHTDPFSQAALRASMGGIFQLSLVRTTAEELRAWATQHTVQLVGLSPDAPQRWSDASLGDNTALVVGEERAGLSPTLRGLCQHFVRLPMTGRADSLNVAVATGVMLYELVRRRG